jgi:hypothetical protein
MGTHQRNVRKTQKSRLENAGTPSWYKFPRFCLPVPATCLTLPPPCDKATHSCIQRALSCTPTPPFTKSERPSSDWKPLWAALLPHCCAMTSGVVRSRALWPRLYSLAICYCTWWCSRCGVSGKRPAFAVWRHSGYCRPLNRVILSELQFWILSTDSSHLIFTTSSY